MNKIQYKHNIIKISWWCIKRALPCFAVSGALLCSAAHAGELIVIVNDIKTAEGYVRAAVFNQRETFPHHPLMGQLYKAEAGSVTFIFKNLPPGKYAVSAFHDLNANAKLDTNFVGKPTEPYGFSRDAHGMFGPPAFDDAHIDLDDSDMTITVHVK